MPLLTKTQHDDLGGLVGLTEDGKLVPIRDPVPCVFWYKESEARTRDVIEDLRREIRLNNASYCQLADPQNAQAVTSEISVLPYIAYLKRSA